MSLLKRCAYIRASGLQCKALPCEGSEYCRTHHRDAERMEGFRYALSQRRTEYSRYALGVTSLCKFPGNEEVFDDTSAGLYNSLKLPPIEDAASLQLHLNAVMRGLMLQLIPPRQAALILYGLQISCTNLPRVRMADPSLDQLPTDKPVPLPRFNDFH